MKYLLIIAYLNGGSLTMEQQPVTTIGGCRDGVEEFMGRNSDVEFQAICVDALKVLMTQDPSNKVQRNG